MGVPCAEWRSRHLQCDVRFTCARPNPNLEPNPNPNPNPDVVSQDAFPCHILGRALIVKKIDIDIEDNHIKPNIWTQVRVRVRPRLGAYA